MGQSMNAPAILYESAMALQPLDPELATDTFLEAFELCTVAQTFIQDITTETIAHAALTSRSTLHKPTTEDMLLAGTAHLFLSEFDCAHASTPRRGAGASGRSHHP